MIDKNKLKGTNNEVCSYYDFIDLVDNDDFIPEI